MGKRGGPRYCCCGTRLAADNCGAACAACEKRASAARAEPPTVPLEFWQTDQMRDALEGWHFGRLIQAYRNHPWHGRPLAQSTVAAWIGLTQTQLSRVENGAAPCDLAKLIQWARALQVPTQLLWFKLPSGAATEVASLAASVSVPPDQAGDPVNRRELLRAMSLAGSLLALPAADELDVEHLVAADRSRTVGPAALDQYGRLNEQLWSEIGRSPSKARALPLARRQVDVLIGHLRDSQTASARRRLCGLLGDLFQLCGEILFDMGSYLDAAHCYSLAASACKETDEVDLWACAMVRHSFVGIYERRFGDAGSLLAGAAELARRGDTALPTRHWVAAVQAQNFAGLGDADRCRRAMDAASLVMDLGTSPTSGWLRFTGSRLDEERGNCLVLLGQPELAESALHEALRRPLSVRRRGGVLADLATVGAQRADAEQAVHYGNAAVDAARQTASKGYLGRKLSILQLQFKPMLDDAHVRNLDRAITSLAAAQ